VVESTYGGDRFLYGRAGTRQAFLTYALPPAGPGRAHRLHEMRHPPVASTNSPSHSTDRWVPRVTHPRSHASADSIAHENDIRPLVRHLLVTWTAVQRSIPSASTSAGGVSEAVGPTGQWLLAGSCVETKRRRGEVMAHRPAWASRPPLFPPVKLFSRAPIPPRTPLPLPFPSSLSLVPRSFSDSRRNQRERERERGEQRPAGDRSNPS
jgi:hypothetical protein